ncbi:MAG: FAD-binding and (Fe-S)-binding domain-containing protein [Agromyces sp.]
MTRSSSLAHPNGKIQPVDPHLITALRSAFPGPDAVSVRASDRLATAHDASHYLLTPMAVVRPKDVDGVATVLAVSASHRTAISFRSGGTSLSGQASTDRILVDTRRNFRDIEVLDQGLRVRVQPGATIRQVNARLSRYKRKLGPDPASEAACTVGGVVANNSSGMACGTETNTYRTLESAVLVLPSGTIIDSGRADADQLLREREPALHTGLIRLRERIRESPYLLGIINAQYSIKNTMGYGLNSFVDHDRPIDILTHLVVGSEGTLAFVAEATFRTVPIKPHIATGLLYFDSLTAATASLESLVARGFATIELLDSASLRVAQRDPKAGDVLASLTVDRHAALLVEYQEATEEALTEQLLLGERFLATLPTVLPPVLTTDPHERAAIWHIRKGLYATIAGSRPSGTTALLEDIAVPVGALLDTCERLTEAFEKYGYTDSVIFGHAKDGNIHFLLNEDFRVPGNIERYLEFTEDLVTLVLGHGGTLKAEHGTGRIMAPYVRRQFGDELYDVMQHVKALCDPAGILNPGVLINEDPQAHVANLKISPTVETEVDRCVECGYCEPVCPSKDLTLTPRQRIVLRREMADAEASGDLNLLNELRQDYQHDGMETCAVDGMCATACPVLIDTGSLVRRLRAESQSALKDTAWGVAAQHWETVSNVGGIALTVAKHTPAPLVSGVTKLARALVGAETVPLWSADLPGGGKKRTPLAATDPQAVFFPACIGTMFAPERGGIGAGQAFLALCERAGVDVLIPDGIGDMCCGTPWKSKGLTDGYEVMRERVAWALWEASSRGRLPVVTDASSCTEGLTVLTELLRRRHPQLRIIDSIEFVESTVLPGLTVGRPADSLVIHPTCSSTQLDLNDSLMTLANIAATTVIVPEDWGCCAFAGDRGMLHPELTASATAREAASLAQISASEYASTNRTCELGMSRATGKPYRHILEILEEATRPSP